jgi:hypothetical protein
MSSAGPDRPLAAPAPMPLAARVCCGDPVTCREESLVIRRLFLTVVVAVLAASLLAGCGALSKKEYIKEMKKIGKKVDAQFEAMSGTDAPPTEATIKKAAGELNDAADEIDKLNPPKDIKSEHKDLVKVMRDAADLFEKLAPSMAKMAAAMENPEALDEAAMADLQEEMTEFTDDMEKIEADMEKVQKAYEDAGYGDIGIGE